MEKVILHADMNNCYASIEIKLNPKWKGLPLAVCGLVEDRHGIVLAKSQEAKVLGVKTGEAIWQAKQKCPDLLIVPPHYDEYLKHSRMAREIYYEYTNQVEPFGIDECWLDVTGSTHIFGSGKEIANKLREQMKKQLGITISVGVSFNKIFAKLGSDLKKPDAVTEISKESFKDIVWKLEVDEMNGIGRATKKKLNTYCIYTLGDLAKANPEFLKRILGINGVYLWNFANGRDDRVVADADYCSPIKSIGHGITCVADLENNLEVRQVLQELSFGVSKRLRENNFKATGVQITVRDNALFSRQYQCPLPFPTLSSIVLTETAFILFMKRYDWNRFIRSLTIRAINLVKGSIPIQIDLFSSYKKQEKKENIDSVIYDIRERFGSKSITFLSLMDDIKIPMERNEIVTLPSGLTR